MNEMKTKLRGVCRGCGTVIIWSAIHRMYRAVSGGYYCPKDGDSKRCQHILEEPKP